MPERIAVIGTGVMGENHARTLRQTPENGAVLSYVVDPNSDRANLIAKKYDAQVATLEELDGTRIDGAIIVSPSRFHGQQAQQLMSQGVHVLVEKPAAGSDEEFEAMQQTAATHERVAMVGHVELFNPVTQELARLFGERALLSLRFKRLGNVTDSSRLYHDVVSDLMVHDLSIADMLLPTRTARVQYASGRSDTLASPDPAEAMVWYEDDYNGVVDAHFRASRAFTGPKTRTIEAETDEGVILADLLGKRIFLRREGEGEYTDSGIYVPTVIADSEYFAPGPQPLQAEQAHFLESMRGNTTPEARRVSLAHAQRLYAMTSDILRRTVLIGNDSQNPR
ncbi:MAG: Gfo/Idh/MocA family oxidoreductase [Candidatus Saccharimonas sp.]